jgi:hypothetical protein
VCTDFGDPGCREEAHAAITRLVPSPVARSRANLDELVDPVATLEGNGAMLSLIVLDPVGWASLLHIDQRATAGSFRRRPYAVV